LQFNFFVERSDEPRGRLYTNPVLGIFTVATVGSIAWLDDFSTVPVS